MSYETLDYELLMKKKNFEVRKYHPFSLIQFESSEADDSTMAFRTLFNYIQGQNQRDEKIPMTTPVFQNKDNAVYRMAFVLPKTLEEPPQPRDPKLSLVKNQGGVFIVHPYRGPQSMENYDKHKKILERILLDRSYIAVDTPLAGFYNSPFTLPFFKHNEVMVQIDEKSFHPVY